MPKRIDGRRAGVLRGVSVKSDIGARLDASDKEAVCYGRYQK